MELKKILLGGLLVFLPLLNHSFLLSLKVAAWMSEKNSIALDESWRDPSNLQAKLQKHQTFQAEIVANQSHLDQIKAVSGFSWHPLELSEGLVPGKSEQKECLTAWFLDGV